MTFPPWPKSLSRIGRGVAESVVCAAAFSAVLAVAGAGPVGFGIRYDSIGIPAALAGFVGLVRRRGSASGLPLWAAVGIVASVPFAPPWDSDLMRVYAATLPLALSFPALGGAGRRMAMFALVALERRPVANKGAAS